MSEKEPMSALYLTTNIAAEFGVFPQTVRDLIRRHAIPTKPYPGSPQGRAVDTAGYRLLQQLLAATAVERQAEAVA